MSTDKTAMYQRDLRDSEIDLAHRAARRLQVIAADCYLGA